MTKEKLVYSIPECADALGVGLTKVRELINSDGFPAIRIGRRVVVPVDQLKVWMAKQPTVANSLPFATTC